MFKCLGHIELNLSSLKLFGEQYEESDILPMYVVSPLYSICVVCKQNKNKNKIALKTNKCPIDCHGLEFLI